MLPLAGLAVALDPAYRTWRFGLWVTFYPFDQDEYLAIVDHWLKTLGCASDDAHEEALQWALQRGSSSGRVAY